MRCTAIAIIAAIFALLADTGIAKPFPRLWVFGDSTVDSGWYKRKPYSGLQKFDKYLSDPTLDVGKPTNNPGPMSVQVLASTLGTTALPANRRGTNYATSGARNHAVNSPNSGFFPNAVPTGQQIDNYLLQHNPTGLDLYVISSGHNDVDNAVANLATPAAEVSVAAAADVLANKIAGLTAAGAKYIIVANLYESFGTPPEKQQYRAIYNATLKAKLGQLGVPYAWGDINEVRKKIDANPSDFGLIYVTLAQHACSKPPPDPIDPDMTIHSAWALVCSPMSVSMPSGQTEKTLWADDGHFATGGQRVIGGYYYCLAKQTWPARFANDPDPPPRKPPFACSRFFPRAAAPVDPGRPGRASPPSN
jgi:phospholipase/lecithinase/hemolysin